MLHRAIAIGAAALFAAGCTAEEAFDQYDEDADGFVSETEFVESTTSTRLFGEWDENADGVLSDPEFDEGMLQAGIEVETFGAWDLNTDEVLTIDEFGTGVFGELDADDDGRLDRTEFAAGVAVRDNLVEDRVGR